jgi:hypothetical protein
MPGGNHQYLIHAESPFLYGATFLVPRAGIELTPHTVIGNSKPVFFSQTRQWRLTARVPRTPLLSVEIESHWHHEVDGWNLIQQNPGNNQRPAKPYPPWAVSDQRTLCLRFRPNPSIKSIAPHHYGPGSQIVKAFRKCPKVSNNK